MNTGFVRPAVATVLTACGIETCTLKEMFVALTDIVATVLTACGIETITEYRRTISRGELQQYLPLAVLKPFFATCAIYARLSCCNSTYRLRY